MNLLLVGHVLGDKMFGSERSLLELIQLIDRDRFNIYCSFPQSETSFFERIKSYVTGVAVFPYRWWSGDSSDTDGYDCDFEEIMRSRRIGLVHVNSIVLRDPFVAARRLKIPSVLHLREVITCDPDLARRIGLPPEQIASEVNSRCDFVIANSHFTQAQQSKSGRSFVLYNTADVAALDLPLRERDGILRVGMLSSNLPKKGVPGFFALASKALERGDPLEFWLIGPETESVKQHLQENGGCPPNVHCAGYMATPDEALPQVDVVINLSTFAESFGRSVGEAMLARRPAVVYEYGALPELVRDGVDGFVVPFRDVEAVLERLNRFVQQPVLVAQMGEAARARGVELFSREVGARRLREVYDSVLSLAGSVLHAGVDSVCEEQIIPSTQKHLRIAYFVWHFPVPSETFVLNELRCLVRRGHDVRVFCRQSPYPEFKPDFPITWEPVDSVTDLAEKLRQSRRQIVHGHFVFPTVTRFLWPACEAAEIPFTFIAHAQDIFRYVNADQNQLREIAMSPWCKAVFGLGSFHHQLFLDSGVSPEKIVINPQGIPTDVFRPENRQQSAGERRRSVCAICRFVEKKGLEYAIRAAASLADYDISLHFYGYGPLEERLRSLAAELGVRNVHFAGSLDGPREVVSALHQHDLLIAPSVRTPDGDMDGIPTVLLEAMACGTPVLASRLSSIPDLVQEGVTGYICEPGNTQSLADSILRFYGDPIAKQEAIVARARETVRTYYDIESTTSTLEQIWSGEGVDIVLVTHNNLAELREVTRRVFTYTTPPFQVCIVDNASDDDTREFLRRIAGEYANVRLALLDENLFVGPGTNRGMALGNNPIIVYLCSKEGFVLRHGWNQRVMNYMKSHPKVGLAGTLAHSPSYLKGKDYVKNLEPFRKFRNQELAHSQPDRTFAHVQGGVMVMRRVMFDEIGGFSDKVPHNHTDVEYSYYAQARGWELGNIPEIAAYYFKTLPPMTAHLTERVNVVHPGSLRLAPLLDKVSARATEFCNVCAQAVDFRLTEIGLVCPACSASPFHRTLYRYISESILPYRRLPALYISTFSGLSSLWEKMFQGRSLGYDALLQEIEEDGKIDLADNGRDLIVLQVPNTIPSPNRRLLEEVWRILSSVGTLIYAQAYGVGSIIRSDEAGFPQTSDEVVASLKSLGFVMQSRINYASVAVRYLDCDLFQCRKLITPVVHS